MKDTESGQEYRCTSCRYIGRCYGTPTSNGASAPWCPRCGRNKTLIKLSPPKPCYSYMSRRVATHHGGLMTICANCGGLPHGLPTLSNNKKVWLDANRVCLDHAHNLYYEKTGIRCTCADLLPLKKVSELLDYLESLRP